NRYPLAIERGKGIFVWDYDGRRYLDLLGGLGVNALGHAHPRIVKIIRRQAAQLIHISNLYYNEYQGQLAEKLCQLSGMARAFFSNSGTEAMEGALKLARAAASQRPGKCGIVALEGSFHGRTFGALSATGQAKYREGFEPLLEPVRFVELNDRAGLQAAGLPLRAFLVREHLANALSTGSHGTTFGGGPLTCRVALEYLQIIEDENLLENVRRVGALLQSELQALASRWDFVVEARGTGFIQALAINMPGRPVVEAAMQEGVLLNSTQDKVLRFLPPFQVKEKHVERALRILRKILKAQSR